MTEELFQQWEEVLSPQRKWMQRRCIHVGRQRIKGLAEPWEAWVGHDREAAVLAAMEPTFDEEAIRHKMFCTGQSRDDALANLAEANGWRLWNEEEMSFKK